MSTRPRPKISAINPLTYQRGMWPTTDIYDKQREITLSTDQDDETYVVAGNKLGKDYIAGRVCVASFLRCIKLGLTCRIVTHSVAEHHLKVLWAEIARAVTTAKYPLIYDRNTNPTGPLVMNYMEIRRASEADAKNPINYLIGRVSDKGEGMAGHHAEFTLFVSDEASGGDDVAYEMAQGWAKHMLIFGNPNPCTNYFKRGVKGGDLRSDDGTKYHRRVITINAEDSPNVKLARAQQAVGQTPTDEIVLPGVLTWVEYQTRRKTWDAERQCVGLDAKFYEGSSIMMFPRTWLDRAENMAELLYFKKARRQATALGVDPAEGGDKTALVAVDELGVVDWEYAPTPDTSKIKAAVAFMMQKHGISAGRVCIDRGGGGKQIADELRAAGHDVKTVSFGESVTRDPQYGAVIVPEKMEDKEKRYSYKNRRAQMYHALRILLDPYEGAATEEDGAIIVDTADPQARKVSQRRTFAIPRQFAAVREELEPIPFTRVLGGQGEGMVYLIPKDKPTPDYKGPTLKTLIGHSPDLADALVLAIYALQQPEEFEIGVF